MNVFRVVLDSQTHCGLRGCSLLGEVAGMSSLSRPLVLFSYCALGTALITGLSFLGPLIFFRAGSCIFSLLSSQYGP